MSSTRHNQSGEFKPEHGLSSPKIKGINIGLNIVCRVARAHDERTRRAMIWLVNFANLRKITADSLCDQLDLEPAAIRAALTDPDYEAMPRFVAKVEVRRARFEADEVPALASTKVNTTVTSAVRYALAERAMVEIIGKTRMGKTDCARRLWLLNLDRAIWVEAPSDESERTFIFAIAAALGVGGGISKKSVQFRPQIFACMGDGLIDLVFVDECHRLWPSDIRTKPKRVEIERELFLDGRGASIVNIGTPQHTTSLNQSLEHNARWAPGQYDGRVVRFHLRDTMSDADLAAVARHYAPQASEAVVAALVLQAKSTEGFCGAMVNTIKLARQVYLDHPADPLTEDAVLQAQAQMARGTRIATLALAPAPRRRAA